MTQDRFTEARGLLEEAHNIAPSDFKVLQKLMLLYFQTWDYIKLEALALDSLRLIPDDPLSKLYLQKAREFEDILNTQILPVFQRSDDYVDLSLRFFNAKAYKLAIRAGQEALRLDPNNPLVFNNICSSHYQLGMYSQAIEACEKALLLKPDWPLAKNNLRLARYKQNL